MWSASARPVMVMPGRNVMSSLPGEKPSEPSKIAPFVTTFLSLTGMSPGSSCTRCPLGIVGSSTSQRFDGNGYAQNSGTIGSQ